MSERVKKAQDLFKQGYNCAQAVAGAFDDVLLMEPDMVFRLTSSFGGGIGRLREVCGAVSAMCMVAGVKDGYNDPKDIEAKKEHYKRIQTLANTFKNENGSIICRELLDEEPKKESFIPEARTESYYQKRPCVQLVGSAAAILEDYLKENEK